MTPCALKRLRARLRPTQAELAKRRHSNPADSGLGLTQAELAARLGLQRNAIARWEMDRRSPHARPIPPMAVRLLAQLAAHVMRIELDRSSGKKSHHG